jgi:NADH-quinone oxidoreductase subunit M
MLGVFALATAHPPSVGVEKLTALNGVFLQMFNHGITAATLFWMVAMLQERRAGLRGIDDFGGVRGPAPILCGLMGIALFSSLGLPGLNGFVGEFLIFKGSFALAKWAAAAALLGLLFTAIFILSIMQKVFWGPVRVERFSDLSRGEIALLAGPIALMFMLGIYPQVLIQFFNVTSMAIVERIGF